MLTIEQAFPNRLAGVIRSSDAETAFRACVAAIEGGIGSVEVTTTVPSCFEIVRGLMASTGGGTPVGVGTVWEPETVRHAKAAGAAFVVTPTLLPEVAQACRRLDVLCVLGALTPTEIRQAVVAGADLVKIFPVAAVGGPSYLRHLGGPMPGVPLWVSGGVEIEHIEEYLRLGVKAVGLTGSLFPPDALAMGDMEVVTERARRASAALAQVSV